jgi:hypothetical protein
LKTCHTSNTRALPWEPQPPPFSQKFYFQYQENSRIYDLLRNHNIAGYFRYVDDILIVYNESTTNIEDLFQCFNNLTPKLKFTLQKEVEQKINFLHLTIQREHNNFSIDIYRKLTFTDIIIPSNSCHPEEHKITAVRYLYNRLDAYHLPPDRRQKEENMIQQILLNNGYSTSAHPSTRNSDKHEPTSEKTMWARFTYCGRERRAITSLQEYQDKSHILHKKHFEETADGKTRPPLPTK